MLLPVPALELARVVGVADQTGSIKPGQAADLLMLDGKLLQDPSGIHRGVLVMKGYTLRPEDFTGQ